jgi:RNA ligase (TIGR02306 family)
MGLLVPADEDMKIGENVAERLGVTKWEEPDPTVSNKGNLKTFADAEHVPFLFVRYTDIENMRRWPDVFSPGEPVVITEKLHGANSRYIYKDGRLWVGSHNTAKKPNDSVMWWKLAKQYNIEEKLKEVPEIFLFGEAYGRVQDLHYGHTEGNASLAFFDAFDLRTGEYMDWDKFKALCQRLELPIAPVMYEGGWDPKLTDLANGQSNLGDNMREGIVVKPLMESFDMRIGRKILKYVSEDYLTRKGGSERH